MTTNTKMGKKDTQMRIPALLISCAVVRLEMINAILLYTYTKWVQACWCKSMKGCWVRKRNHDLACHGSETTRYICTTEFRPYSPLSARQLAIFLRRRWAEVSMCCYRQRTSQLLPPSWLMLTEWRLDSDLRRRRSDCSWCYMIASRFVLELEDSCSRCMSDFLKTTRESSLKCLNVKSI